MNQIFLKNNPKIVQKHFEKTQTRFRWSLGVEGGVLGFVLGSSWNQNFFVL